MEVTYEIINSTISDVIKNVEFDGDVGELKVKKLVVEMGPKDNIGGTIKLVLPVDMENEFSEGKTVVVTYTVEGE